MDLASVGFASLLVPSDVVLLSVHLAATAAMFGLIWFVQVVHYPLFAAIGRDGFAAYETAHRRRTAFVVGPLMAAEGLTAEMLVIAPPVGVGLALPVAGVVVLGVIHMSTVWLQVPRHAELNEGYDDATLRRLVRSNWVRTVGWSGSHGTMRTVIGLELLFEEGRSWSWRVAGRPGTDRVVEASGPDVSRVAFGVPWIEAGYVVVCRIALGRLDALGRRAVTPRRVR